VASLTSRCSRRQNGRAPANRDIAQLLGLVCQRVDADNRHLVGDVDVARRTDDVALSQGGDDFGQGHSLRVEFLGSTFSTIVRLAASKGWRRGHPWQAGEDRARSNSHALQLADRPLGVLGCQDQVADRDAAGVEAHDEGGDRAGA